MNDLKSLSKKLLVVRRGRERIGDRIVAFICTRVFTCIYDKFVRQFYMLYKTIDTRLAAQSGYLHKMRIQVIHTKHNSEELDGGT